MRVPRKPTWRDSFERLKQSFISSPEMDAKLQALRDGFPDDLVGVWEASFKFALMEFLDGRGEKLATFFDAQHRLTPENYHDLAWAIRHAKVVPSKKKERGRPADPGRWSLAWEAEYCFRQLVWLNQQAGIDDHRDRSDMREEVLRFAIERIGELEDFTLDRLESVLRLMKDPKFQAAFDQDHSGPDEIH